MPKKHLPRLSASFFRLLGLLFLFFGLLGVGQQETVRSQTNVFLPGEIISDAVLTNEAAMTAEEIQDFLKSKVKGQKCNRWQTNSSSVRRGLDPPWTCLFEFVQNPATQENNYGQFDGNGRPARVVGGLNAGQLIAKVARDFQVNPQVILTLLQKQQGLVTDDWPWPSQYSAATGYTCPSNNPCPAAEARLYQQLVGLGQRIRQGLNNPSSLDFRIGSNQIPYHPRSSCGQKEVVITSQATAVLYSLEPYTPNQAALDNFVGEGDSCSSYGLRNFWIQFNKWFGQANPNPTPSPPTPPEIPTSNPDDQTTNTYRGFSFNPGLIISDAVFENYQSMTVGQIQAFLEDTVRDSDSSLPGNQCWRYQENDSSIRRNLTPPWTCLFEFIQNPTTGEHNFGKFDELGRPAKVAGGLSAAEIIYQAGQKNRINPQVILVLLQKEQGLVTDNWPWPRQYSKATGWACPDDSPCDPEHANFYLQVNLAAAGFRNYLDTLGQWWYRIGSNQILYHPNTACGHQEITIENGATVALYLYTPYAPNQAALSNLLGEGDSCSSYGNRNFWIHFIKWFGDPLVGRQYSGRSQTVHPSNLNSVVTQPPANQPATGQKSTGDPLQKNRFNPGHIVSDKFFTKTNSLTVAEIQSFLESAVIDSDLAQAGNQCWRNKAVNRRGSRLGYSPPWTCLFEFIQNPTTGEHNFGKFDKGRPAKVAGGQTAAEIIYQAGQKYQINSQILLAFLQKEQNLVTDNWPWPNQFAKAGGQNCLLDSDCFNDIRDFSWQIEQLAQKLKKDFNQPRQGLVKIGFNQLAHNPNSRCGQTGLNLVNAATVALYRQTPFVANEAALTGQQTGRDSCSRTDWREFWKNLKFWF